MAISFIFALSSLLFHLSSFLSQTFSLKEKIIIFVIYFCVVRPAHETTHKKTTKLTKI